MGELLGESVLETLSLLLEKKKFSLIDSHR